MMDTQKLIGALAADAKRESQSMRTSWAVALGAAAVLAAIAFFALIGPRPDIADAAQTVRFLFKFVVTVALGAAAIHAVSALALPETAARRALPILAAAPILLLAGVVAELASVPAGEVSARMIGTNAAICLTFIPLIGIGPLAAFLVVLRRGAPSRPTLAGAVAGLAAGGIAATFYAAHCTDDSPLFVATWYPLAVAILAAAGSALGGWFARW